MENRLFIVLAAFLLFGTCCNNEATSSNNEMESSTYLPLSIGNKWIYQGGENPFTVTVDEKVAVNGTDYFVLSTLGEDSYPDTIRGKNNVIWKYSDGKEVVWFNFNAEDGAKYIYKDYNVTVQKNVDVKNSSGLYSNCVAFYFDIPRLADEEIRFVFARGVGVVSMPTAWL